MLEIKYGYNTVESTVMITPRNPNPLDFTNQFPLKNHLEDDMVFLSAPTHPVLPLEAFHSPYSQYGKQKETRTSQRTVLERSLSAPAILKPRTRLDR